MSRHEPMFNVPGSVLAVLGAMVAVHLVRLGLPQDWDTWLTVALAFIPARYAGFAAELPGGDVAAVTSFLTHGLVHGDWLHLGLNAAWLVAFGGAVANRVGTVRFLCAVCALRGGRRRDVPGFQSGSDGADGRRIGCDLRADGRHHALPVHCNGRARSCRTAGRSALGAADATRHGTHGSPGRAGHRSCFSSPISWRFSAWEAWRRVALPGRRTSAAISPVF